LVLAVVLLSGCDAPLPVAKQDYVGTWRRSGLMLTITPGGHVEYERVTGSVRTSISAPIRRFEGDDFIVGVPGVTTTFQVQRRPFQDGGDWKMVVDGTELVRAR
jgi:hypothetical protein